MNNFEQLSFNKIQESIKLHESVIRLNELIDASGGFDTFDDADVQGLKKSREEITGLIKSELAKKARSDKLRTAKTERNSLQQEADTAGERQKVANKKLNEKINQIEILKKEQ